MNNVHGSELNALTMPVYTEYWTLILGIILILLIFFLPEGVMGFLEAKFKAQTQTTSEG